MDVNHFGKYLMIDNDRKLDTFCVLPFYGKEYPMDVPCCEMTRKVHDSSEIQKQMLNGERPAECSKCWKLEDSGIRSDRQIKNDAMEYYLGKDISFFFDECSAGNNSIRHYKITTSNVCNSTCVTCGSLASSQWGRLENDNGVAPHPIWRKRESDFNINYQEAACILFLGGEPMSSKTTFDILRKLKEHGNTDCFISMVTNGSFDLTDKRLDALLPFKNVNFSFSLDGTDRVFEYMRFPLKWTKILENIELCNSYGMEVSVNHTVSNLNVMYYDQTTNWFKDNGIVYRSNPVSFPAAFRTPALPQKVKELIIERSESSEVESFLSSHSEKDDHDFELFKVEIAKQDRWKGICGSDYLPEFFNLIDGY